MKSRQDFITDAEWWEYYRQYSAAMAMQGILSAQAGTKEMVQMQAEYYAKNYPGKTMNDAIAIESVNGADALINALNQQK